MIQNSSSTKTPLGFSGIFIYFLFGGLFYSTVIGAIYALSIIIVSIFLYLEL